MDHGNEMVDAIGLLTRELAAAVTYQLQLTKNRQTWRQWNKAILSSTWNGIKSITLLNKHVYLSWRLYNPTKPPLKSWSPFIHRYILYKRWSKVYPHTHHSLFPYSYIYGCEYALHMKLFFKALLLNPKMISVKHVSKNERSKGRFIYFRPSLLTQFYRLTAPRCNILTLVSTLPTAAAPIYRS